MAGKAREFRDFDGSGNIFEFVLREAGRVRSFRAGKIARQRADVMDSRRAEYARARQDDAELPAKVAALPCGKP